MFSVNEDVYIFIKHFLVAVSNLFTKFGNYFKIRFFAVAVQSRGKINGNIAFLVEGFVRNRRGTKHDLLLQLQREL